MAAFCGSAISLLPFHTFFFVFRMGLQKEYPYELKKRWVQFDALTKLYRKRFFENTSKEEKLSYGEFDTIVSANIRIEKSQAVDQLMAFHCNGRCN